MGTVDGSDVVELKYGTTTPSEATAGWESNITFAKDFTFAKATPTCGAPSDVTATYGQKLSEITLTNPTGNTDGTWSWTDGDQFVGNVSGSPHTYTAKFTPTDGDTFVTVENISISVTVSAKSLTDVVIGSIDDQGYTGSQIRPTVNVTGDGGKTLTLNTDYTVEYGTNKNVGTNSGSVTVKQVTGGNYTFTDVTKNFTIVAAASTISITGDPGKTYDGAVVTNPAVNKTGSTGTVTFEYYTNEGGTTKTGTADGATSEGGAPKNAGTYWVKATVAADANYGGATSEAKQFTISRKSISGATVTLNATEKPYSGSEQTVSVSSVTLSDGTTLSTSDYTVSSNNGTDAETYTVTVTGTGNYKDTASTTWTISPLEVELTWANYSDRTYDGSAANVTATVSNKKGSDDVSVTVTDGNKTDVGDYTATATGLTGTKAGNYKLPTTTPTQAYKITEAAITVDTDAFKAYSGEYDGNAHSITVDTSKITTVNGQTATVKYGTTAGSYESTTLPTPTDVGTSTVYWQVTAPNHAANTGSTTITITAKNVSGLTAVVSDQNTIKDVGEFTDPVIKGVKNEALEGTLTYSYDSATGKSHDDVVNMLKEKAANAEITLNYSFTPSSGNYTGTKTGSFKVTVKDIEFKVGDADATAANAIEALFTDTTYGKTWSERISVKVDAITAKVGTNSVTGNYTIVPESGALSDRPGVGTKNYTVKFTGGSYTDVTVFTGSITVTAKEVTISGITASDKEYNGNDSATVSTTGVTFGGIVDGDSLTISASGTFVDANAGTNKTVNLSLGALDGASKDNYTLASTGNQTTTTASITPKEVTLTDGIQATGRQYNNTNVVSLTKKDTVTFTGLVGTEDLDINIPTTGTVEAAQVGNDKVVSYSGVTLADGTTGKASNYTLSTTMPEVKVNITQATLTEGTDKSGNIRYTDTAEKTFAYSDFGFTQAGTFALKSGSSVTDSSSVLATSYPQYGDSVKVKLKDSLTLADPAQSVTIPLTFTPSDTNYAAKEVTLTITLTDKNTPTVSANDITVTYSGSPVPATAITGTATFNGHDVTGTWSFTSAALVNVSDSNTSVGVTFTPTDGTNYSTVATTIKVTINKATPTGEPTYTAITTSGKTLADAVLTIGSITPAGGSIAWNSADTTVITANTAYGWTYTPAVADQANYNTLTGTLTPYTVSYSGGGGGGGSSTYAISADKAQNGSITVSPKNASKGDTVTVTVAPDKGYTLETLTVLDKNGKEITVTAKDGKYTFKMPASKVSVKATFMEDNTMLNFFVDVPADAYYYDAVLWAAENGITGGVDSVHFAPNAACTRAQIVTFLWRAAGCPEPKALSTFSDVPADAYYAKAVAWAVENGITGGIGGNRFAPDTTCTRAQSVTFLYRAAGSPAVSDGAAFSDVNSEAYYANAVAWAAKQGITGGIGGGLFGSNNDCTRAQIVTFLYRSIVK